MPRRNRVLVPSPAEVKRRRLLKIFDNPDPIWKPEDHPEIDDAGDWLRKMRAESETRFNRIQIHPDRG